MAVRAFLNSVLSGAQLLVITSPRSSPWTSFALWVIRLLTFSVILRTYLVPLCVHLLFQHFRVRSVSLRSIRGIYFRQGRNVWHVDRIGLSYHRPSGPVVGRLTIKVEGLKLEISERSYELKHFPTRANVHHRMPTLADFAPSPMAYRLRSVISAMYAGVEPYFRPLVRSCFISALRLLIRCLPALTQILDFEVDSALLELAELPGVSISLNEMFISSKVVFTQVERVTFTEAPKTRSLQKKHSRFLSMIDWRSRLSSNVKRTWARAWGKTRGTVSISVKFHEFSAMSSVSDGASRIFCLPYSMFHASVDINSSRGVEPHSFEAKVSLASINVSVDLLRLMVTSLKSRKCTENPPFSDGEADVVSSPLSSPRSQVSPTVPFMTAFSMTSIPFRFGSQLSPQGMKAARTFSILSSVKRITFQVAEVNLDFGTNDGETESLQLKLRQISVSTGLSNGNSNALHKDILGRSADRDELDHDVYMVDFSMEQLMFERIHDGMDLNSTLITTVSQVGVHILVTQWPGLGMVNSAFMSGDPNAALLALRLKIARVDIVDDWESIRNILLRSQSQSSSVGKPPALPSAVSPVPRVFVELEVGQIRANLPFSRLSNQVALEMKSNGLTMSVSSHFLPSPSRLHNQPHTPLYETLPIRMRTILAVSTEPLEIGVRVNSMFDNEKSSAPFDDKIDPLETAFEPVVTIDALELTGSGTTSASILDTDVVSLDISSTFVDLHCVTDALSVELWHPGVMSTMSMLVDVTSQQPNAHTSPHGTDRLMETPLGFRFTIALGRFTIFVTSPDINPSEEMDISRGIAFHSGVSLEYCSILPSHVASVGDVSVRAQNRQKLYLPEELIMDSLSKIRFSQQSHQTNDRVRLFLWDTGLRSAVATAFVADDPYSIEGLPSAEQNQEFLSIPWTRVDFTYPSKCAGQPTHFLCNMDIPSIRFKLELVHTYSLLLAIHTLQSLLIPKGRLTSPDLDTNRMRSLPFGLQVTVHTLEMLFNFPTKQSICTRVNNLNLQLSPSYRTNIQWETWFFWVPRPRWKDEDGPGESKWEEFICLREWNIFLEYSTRSISASVKAEAARIRIPHQFVLAELVLSIILTVKCVGHLAKLIPAAKFVGMDIPGAEDPKNVPEISIEVHRLIAEAADDPFESKLAVISHAGFRASEIMRTHRDAFDAKVAAIIAAESPSMNNSDPIDESDGYRFSSRHSITIEEARERLLSVHSKTWREVHKAYLDQHHKQEQARLLTPTVRDDLTRSTLITVTPTPYGPPLFRITIESLRVDITRPSFPPENLSDFLYEQGAGQPRDTKYFLLIPFNLSLSMASLQANLRDYPLPLISIHPGPRQEGAVFAFDSDLVIAEQMGTPDSVEWWSCAIVNQDFAIMGASPFSLDVPKTIMPVKTFANPVIRVTTPDVTDICWGVSYSAAIQDVMRIIETLSSAPRDPSPPLGFWDKLRLVFHWKILASFKGDVHFHMKGSRDPYNILHDGAGFALCWSGNPKILIGQQNEDSEQIQVTSDVMSVTIPNFEKLHEISEPPVSSFGHYSHKDGKDPSIRGNLCELRKSCAKLASGVRFGVRFDLERACGSECNHCNEPVHRRKCRHFIFRPHYDVKLERKPRPKAEQASIDSYEGFRSDFIHMSISLTSAVRQIRHHDQPAFSSFHLTPKAFAQFWHWWGLFDNRLSLPIRQGSYYRHKLVTPKFGRHLATIKYRISIPHLFISHVYIDESRQAWSDGITRFVGIKALIDHFHADMHQRDQESTQFNSLLGTTEVVRHKPFNVVEVVLRGLDLRAMLATFEDPVKRIIFPEPCPEPAKDRIRSNLPVVDPRSIWIDKDDFTEIDWCSTETPKVNLLHSAGCPHFTYFKRTVEPDCSEVHQRTEYSKFGNEDTHVCLLGKESSGYKIQSDLVSARIEELRKCLTATSDDSGIRKMISLLDDYVLHLQDSSAPDAANYYMATDTVSPSEWSSYDNVYQVHCPKLFMNESNRDILIQYYYCSVARRGFEYHLATRAVKFIRDQDLLRDQANFADDSADDHQSPKSPASVAQAAVHAFLKSFNREYEPEAVVNMLCDPYDDSPLPGLDSLEGWSHGVSLERSHFCVLLKPQIVLQSEANTNSVCVVAAGLAKLYTNAIMDDSNVDDPISGKIMSRTYVTLHGLQTFSPSQGSLSADGCVPVEVLIDFRCESSDFDRLVPQTEATIRYDKFNRLRLRNNVTSVTGDSDVSRDNAHLLHQTDLLKIHVPQFTVSATDGHFAAISDIVTKLLLFSDATHKTRLDRLETLLFSYDFTDFASSANVVSDLQSRLREAVEQEQAARWRLRRLASSEDQAKLEMAKIRADVLALADELSYVFEAIGLAQDKFDGNSDQKSALLLLASSPEISWRMLDSQRDLLAKLSVKDAKFSWLSRQDSSTVNNLRVGDLHAFDGSANAAWSEILCKHNEPTNHPLVKRDLFAVSNWTVLAPVGGIAIYENFDVSLHPIRLQLDTKVGERIMEYIWPARKHRRSVEHRYSGHLDTREPIFTFASPRQDSDHTSQRPPLDARIRKSRKSLDSNALSAGPPRRLGTSRSFTDLRSATLGTSALMLQKNRSTDALSPPITPMDSTSGPSRKPTGYRPPRLEGTNDAAEMKNRSSQKTFVAVDIASLHLLLSVMKEDAFLCRDARLNTRDLHYRNQVWSLEELVDQFIPSDPSWKGWVKVAFQQPFFEVFPVARELFSKTRRIASKGTQQLDIKPQQAKKLVKTHAPRDDSAERRVQKLPMTSRTPLTDEPEPMNKADPVDESLEILHPINPHSRPRFRSLFRRNPTHSRLDTGSESTIVQDMSKPRTIYLP